MLYQIDPRPFEIQLARALASKEEAEAQLALAEAQVARLEPLAEEGYATGENLDEALARREELTAAIMRLEAEIEDARINLDFASIRAPFSGRIGFSNVDAGDLVSAGGTPLTSLVQLDPLEVEFEISGDDISEILRRLRDQESLAVDARLRGQDDWTLSGRLTEVDNQVDRQTGTVTAQARFENDDEGMLPGQYVRIRVILEEVEAVCSRAMIISEGRLCFDGTPGELFITMAKEGSTIGGLMDTIATLVSVSLQYGVKLEDLVRKFEHVRFEGPLVEGLALRGEQHRREQVHRFDDGGGEENILREGAPAPPLERADPGVGLDGGHFQPRINAER